MDIYDSTPEGHGSPTGWGVWGGTSVSSPILAAEFALVGGAHGVEYPAATLYPHLGDPAALADPAAGSNGSCAGSTECQAVVGFDGPTGVGSPLGLSALSVAGVPPSTAAPGISGFAEQGQMLQLIPGSWSNAPSTTGQLWARCNAAGYACAPIAGAGGSSYTITAADVGSTIRVQEVAANAAGEGPPAAAPASAVVASGVPSIAGFTPTSGITGSALRIEGGALAGVQQVELGKLQASFTVISPSTIEAIVPDGAKAGKLTILAPGASVKTKARFTPTFSLVKFSPKHGAVGRTVKLTGVGFTPDSSVSFAGVRAAAVTYISPSRIEAAVPAGASSGSVTVSNATAPVGTVSAPADFQIP